MQKAFLKLAFLGTVFASMSFAGGTDLLSLATDGAVTTAKAEMVGVKVLSGDEMKDVVGGAWYYAGKEIVKNQGVIVYKVAYGTITEQYLGKETRVYGRYMTSNGATTAWLKYNNNGSWSQPYNTEAVRLTNLYRQQAVSTARNLPNY